jgi:hypothetical protein
MRSKGWGKLYPVCFLCSRSINSLEISLFTEGLTSFKLSLRKNIFYLCLGRRRPVTRLQMLPNMAPLVHLSPSAITYRSPIAQDKANERVTKRRSSRACLSCRNRKVRCDVVHRGLPCNNCRLDNVECVLKESKRRRRVVRAHSPAATVLSVQGQPEEQHAITPSRSGPDNYQTPQNNECKLGYPYSFP